MRVRLGLALVVALVLGSIGTAQADRALIRGVQVVGQKATAKIIIDGNFSAPKYSVRASQDGRVITVDVEGVSLPDGGLLKEGRSALVSRTVTSTSASGVRIEVSLTSSVTYHARAEKNRIVVQLSKGEGAQRGLDSTKSKRKQRGAIRITSVHVEKRNDRDRVVVELNREAPFRVSTRAGSAPRLEILGGVVGRGVERRVKAPTDSILRRVELTQEGDRAVIEAYGQTGLSGTAIRSGNRIIWMFDPIHEENPRPKSRTLARERDFASEVATPEVAGFLTDMPMQIGGKKGRRYSGRRIDLDFKEADIHNILRLLSEVGGVNVITSDNVSGSVTIRMRNVPWDQALDVILQAKGLGMIRRANLIRVAPATVLQQEREAAIAQQKQQMQLAPLETRLVPVSYATASELAPRVRELLSERGTVSVDERTNMLVVRDIVDSLGGVEDLVRSLDTQTPQVLIEARIVEASSQYSRDVGIQWGGGVTLNSTNGNPTGLVFPSNVAVAGGATGSTPNTQGLSPFSNSVAQPNYAVNLPAVAGAGSGGAIGLALGSLGGNVNLNVRLSAAESTGSVRIVSSPRILTLDNHEATISQGTLIPFSQVSAQGVNTAFQEATLELKVKPHVTSDGSVSMHVSITRDEPDFGRTSAQGDPTILKRQAETDLLVRDGDTAVIGGIFTRNTGRNLDQVPFFGDIPVLGVLFRKRTFREDRNELLIFLTPRIVNRDQALPQS